MTRIMTLAAVLAILSTAPAFANVDCFKTGDNLECTGVDENTGDPIHISGVIVDGSGTLSGTVGEQAVDAQATPAGRAILVNGNYEGGQITGECYLNEAGTTCL